MKPGDLRLLSDGGTCLLINLYEEIGYDGLPAQKANIIIDGQVISMSTLQLKYTTRAIKHGTR